MAQSYNDPAGGTYIIPGAYPSIKVQSVNSGLSTTGVLALIGEADAGPDFTSESDISLNFFGPDQLPDVVAKYGSGNLVEAFRQACGAAVDPAITGSFSRAYLIKTNKGTKAYGTLQTWGSTNWYNLSDSSYGSLGNRTYFSVTQNTKEVEPDTGLFSLGQCAGSAGYAVGLRVNGGVVGTATIAAGDLPAAVVTKLNTAFATAFGSTFNAASGGAARANPIWSVATPNVTIAVQGTLGASYVATFTLSTGVWIPTVAVGDVMILNATVAAANRGSWVVTAISQSGGANSTILTAYKIADLTGTGTPGTVTYPTNETVNAVPSASGNAYAPVRIQYVHGNPINGIGKSIEISATSGTDVLTNYAYQLGSVNKVSWISTSTTPTVLASSAEYQASLNTVRQTDGVAENLVAGGEIGLKLGYKGTSCAVTIYTTNNVRYMQMVAVGGTGAGTFTLNLSNDYSTIADLAAYINSLSGFSCAPGTSVIGYLPPTALDQSTWGTFSTTYGAGSEQGAYTARIKVDAYRFANIVNGTSVLVDLGYPTASVPGGGLPQPTVTSVDKTDPTGTVTYSFLSGGSKGGTSGTDITNAMSVLTQLRVNFVVPLFSRDAGSSSIANTDIYDGLTDATSTYTIAGVNAAVKSHVAQMSTVKARRNRQAFLSQKDTFANVSNAAANVAYYRCAFTFEDFKQVNGTGTIQQFQPWMGSVLAAATQAAGFYQSIVHKAVNTTGVIQAAGDWSYTSDTNLETALQSGLLPVSRSDTGGFYWVSDQTTYGKDSNPVYNSIQMVYAADIIALTTAQRMENAFVGRSIADVSAVIGLSYLDGIMADFLRLKLIAPSDDAPLGYKNASIRIEGPAMRVYVEVKVAGSIYFIPITFYVTQVTQTASQR